MLADIVIFLFSCSIFLFCLRDDCIAKVHILSENIQGVFRHSQGLNATKLISYFLRHKHNQLSLTYICPATMPDHRRDSIFAEESPDSKEQHTT